MYGFGLRRGLRLSVPILLSTMAVPASAQDLSYEPIDPSFGGNPFNSAHLLGVANAQNDYDDPDRATTNSQADIFPPIAVAPSVRSFVADRGRHLR